MTIAEAHEPETIKDESISASVCSDVTWRKILKKKGSLREKAQLKAYQLDLFTAGYMLDPWEKVILCKILVLIHIITIFFHDDLLDSILLSIAALFTYHIMMVAWMSL